MFLKLKNAGKRYEKIRVLDNINMNIDKGEFVCILGPNGCGKTTLLKIIMGVLEHDGEVVRNTSKIGYVSQNPQELLLPWFTVKKNMIFPLNKNNHNKKLLKQLMNLTNLKKYENNYPYELSGGMEYMLLISRALINNADLVLLDEPFKSLDFTNTEKLQKKLLELWELKKPAIIMISHDVTESILLADKIIILSEKPSKIKKIININLPRKNRHELINSQKFIEITEEIRNEFKKY